MKKQIILILFILNACWCSAQTHNLQVGYDASFHSFQDMYAALFFASYTYNISEKIGVQAEYHTAYGGEALGQNSSTILKNGVPVGTTSTSQVGRPLSAYPEIKANQLGYKQLDPNDEHFTYNTFDLSALYNLIKRDKNELYVALGISHTSGSREYIPAQIAGTFVTTNFTNPDLNNRQMFLVIPFYERFLAFGYNAKLGYNFNINDRIAVGSRFTYHSFFQTKGSYYISTGINFQVKF
jgi:hypothetical protein